MAEVNNVAEAIEKIGVAFEEYKKVNDARLDAIKKDASIADFEAKLAKIDADLDKLSEVKSQIEKLETHMARPGLIQVAGSNETPAQAQYKAAFFEWLRNPKDIGKSQELQQLERKTQSVVTSTPGAGGYALPEFIERTIARLTADISPIRSIATVRQVSTPDYKELFDVGGASFEWIGETDTRSQTDTPDLEEVAPTFGMSSAKPQASEESLDDLFFNVEQWLIDAVTEAFAVGEGAAFISGNGTKKPTGFLTGTPVATSDASRDFGVLQFVASGQAAAMPADTDKFLDLVYALRARYRANARWVTSKSVLAALRKYKDKEDNHLWQPALAMGQPATFMGYGITEAEDMPAVAANAFPLAFGDFREGYLIADRVGMRITRDEITTPGYVKFYCRRRVGGILRNSQAIKLLKIAA